jgi:glycosyltransferase involved in cell wall biosynthesis
MNKTLEYMAFELPVVAFDLKETRVSAENAACYVPDGDIPGFARTIVRLLDDEPLRRAMGDIGRARIEGAYGWPYQEAAYVRVYDHLVGRPASDESRVIVLPEDDAVSAPRVPRPSRPVAGA